MSTENKDIIMPTMVLPGYTFGGDEVYDEIPDIVGGYGKKICIIGGETALAKTLPTLKPVLEKNNFEIVDTIVYGKECVSANSKRISEMPTVKSADVLFAVGGGKAIDSVKLVSNDLGDVPFFTFPTVASTCAATSKVAAVYNEDHSFDTVRYGKRASVHVFINARILVEAPKHFIWAGMGDTLSKYYECELSARGHEIPYEIQMGVTLSRMSAEPILKYAKDTMKAAEKQTRNGAFDQTVMSIIYSNGIVSNFLTFEYLSSVAHAMCYGLITQPVVEQNHFHGEIVSYGVLVLLTLDKNYEERDKWLKVYKEIGLPTKLADLEVSIDVIDPIITKAASMPDVELSAFPVTKAGLLAAVEELEGL